MAILTKGQTFADGDDVTHTKLNNLVDAAAFVAGSSGTTDDSTLEVNGGGRLQIKDSGVAAGKIAASAVTTSKLADSSATTNGVTFPKMRYIADMKVIGNVSGGETYPAEVSILDEDDMTSDSATSLASQQSIKAYVDTTSTTQAQAYGMNYDGTVVVSGTLATSYTDLDLSSIVGTNRALVYLRVLLDRSTQTFFRTNGDTVDVSSRSGITGNGVSAGSTGPTIGNCMVMTDASGVIEYSSDNGGNGASTITVVAYQLVS